MATLNDFKGLTDLRAHLKNCHKKQQEIDLVSDHLEKDVLQFVLSHIHFPDHPHSFIQGLDILLLLPSLSSASLTALIDQQNSTMAKPIHSFSLTTINAIENFYQKIHSSSHLMKKITADSKTRAAFQALSEKMQAIYRHKQYLTREYSQKKYAQLLDNIIEDPSLSQTLIPLLQSSHHAKKSRPSLLSKKEFDIPRYEPEHPDEIGINKTMSFIPHKDYASLFAIFSTASLKKSFLNAFPWGMDTNQLGKKSIAAPQSYSNLLQIHVDLPFSTQMQTLQCILLYMDILGKLCGKKGNHALQYYIPIKAMTDELKKLSTALKRMPYQSPLQYENELKNVLQKLMLMDKRLYHQRRKKNTSMNDFCHLNEYLSQHYLDLPHQDSLLTPVRPSHPLFKK